MVFVEYNPELEAQYKELRDKLEADINELRKSREEKIDAVKEIRAEADKLMEQAGKIIQQAEELRGEAYSKVNNANTEYIKAVKELESKFLRDANRIEIEYAKQLRAKKEAEDNKKESSAENTRTNIYAKQRENEKVFTGNPFLDLLLNAMIESANAHKDEEVEHCKCNDEHECNCGEGQDEHNEHKCSCGECTCHKDEITVEDKVNFVVHKLNQLDIVAKAKLGLTDARVIKVRNEHTCSMCGQIINPYTVAVVADKLSVFSVPLSELSELNTLTVKDGVLTLQNKYDSTTKFTKTRHWMCLDDVYDMLKALEE